MLGVPLNHLVGKRFRAGEVILFGGRLNLQISRETGRSAACGETPAKHGERFQHGGTSVINANSVAGTGVRRFTRIRCGRKLAEKRDVAAVGVEKNVESTVGNRNSTKFSFDDDVDQHPRHVARHQLKALRDKKFTPVDRVESEHDLDIAEVKRLFRTGHSYDDC